MALCTLTLMVQVPTGVAGLAKSMWVAVAAAVTVPPQLLTTVGVLATTRFDGRLSTKLPSIATTLPLVMPKVRVLGVFGGTLIGLKLLLMVGGFKMMMPALAVPPPELPSPELFAVYVNEVVVG